MVLPEFFSMENVFGRNFCLRQDVNCTHLLKTEPLDSAVSATHRSLGTRSWPRSPVSPTTSFSPKSLFVNTESRSAPASTPNGVSHGHMKTGVGFAEM